MFNVRQMNITLFTDNDLIKLDSIQPDAWPDIRPSFLYYIQKRFCIPVKISLKNRLIGVGAGIFFDKRTAWLAHIIVAPDMRNRGIGFKIVTYLTGELAQLGCKSISLIATDSGYPVYKKAGFVRQAKYLFFKKETDKKKCFPCLPETFQPVLSDHKPDILKLDRQVSGENREKLLSGCMKNGWVVMEKGGIQGVYLPDLGEGLIIAENDPAGLALMRYKYTRKRTAVLPENNTAGVAFLEENGFVLFETARRMILGNPFVWYPEKIYSRIAGNVG